VGIGRIVTAVELILERLHTHVTANLTVPWPPVEGAAPDHFGCPLADWRDGILPIWFASHEGPVTPVVEVPLSL
jgi:hypothetical protein